MRRFSSRHSLLWLKAPTEPGGGGFVSTLLLQATKEKAIVSVAAINVVDFICSLSSLLVAYH